MLILIFIGVTRPCNIMKLKKKCLSIHTLYMSVYIDIDII